MNASGFLTAPELLAPAGGAAALRAAVQSGADAVYIGGPMFNARSGADNFSIGDIKKYARYCHLYGVDLHVALNTLIKERELNEMLEYAYELNDAGADALIIQDIGAAELIRKALPDMPLHASTQMTVTSLEGVRYLEDMGFSRVVLARELSRGEIEYICKNARAEIEIFVHGALCMCYSGQCLMSSILGGRSGNRGRCAQPCRLPYGITDGKNSFTEGYLLSPKDLSLINELKAIRDMGVASLKIEGRLKRAEYVSAVVGVYRKYLDNIDRRVEQSDMEELINAFSRSGFTDGYFNSHLGKSMMSHKNPGNDSGNAFTAEAKKRAAENANIRKIPVNVTGTLNTDELVEITIYNRDTKNRDTKFATAAGTLKAERAINRPLDKERFAAQLSKLGDTPFEAVKVIAQPDGKSVVPIKEINSVRREAADALIRELSEREKGRKAPVPVITRAERGQTDIILTAEVMTEEQGEAAIKGGINMIYAPFGVAEKLTGRGAEIITKASEIFRAAEYYRDKRLYGGFRLNVFNSRTADHFKGFESLTLSPELNIGEIRALLENTGVCTEVIVYGRLPLMLMKNCPLKAAGKCQSKKMKYRLRDRMKEEFPVVCSDDCRAVLLNSKPIFMADKLDQLKNLKINRIRMIFTVENFLQCGKIIDVYKRALAGEAVPPPADGNSFTRGHFFRGVK